MNRQLVLSTKALSLTHQATSSLQQSRSRSSCTGSDNRVSPNTVNSIREWLASFNNNTVTIPPSVLKFEQNLSRSSRKTICRAPISALKTRVPQKVLDKLQDSTYYKRGSDAVVTTSGKTASTNVNRLDSIKKMNDLIQKTAEDLIAEGLKNPPKQLPKPPPGRLTRSEGRKRFEEHKKLRRSARAEDKIERALEERRNPAHSRND